MSANCARCSVTIPPTNPAYLIGEDVVCRDCKDKAEPLCPYCQKQMKRKLPKSYGKCPSCRAEFHINSEQWFFDTTILTRQQNDGVYEVSKQARAFQPWGVRAEEVEQWTTEARLSGDGPAGVVAKIREVGVRRAMNARPTVNWSISQPELELALRVTEHLWYQVGNFVPDLAARSVEAVLNLKEQFRAMPSWMDVAWRVLIDVGLLAHSPNDESSVLQAKIGILDLQDRDSKPHTRLWMISEARGHKEMGFPRIKVLACPQSCLGAKALHHKEFPIDEFIRNCPMPVEGCTGDSTDDRGPIACRCDIVAAGEIQLGEIDI